MGERIEILSHSEEETHELGRRFAASLQGSERIGLAGELGAGKTCFVRGIAEGLGISPELVRSPTFTLLVPHEGGRLPLYHVDLFRLAPGMADAEDLREILYGTGVCAIEWFDRLREPLEDFLEIELTFVGETKRRLVAVGHGVGYHHMMRALEESAD